MVGTTLGPRLVFERDASEFQLLPAPPLHPVPQQDQALADQPEGDEHHQEGADEHSEDCEGFEHGSLLLDLPTVRRK